MHASAYKNCASAEGEISKELFQWRQRRQAVWEPDLKSGDPEFKCRPEDQWPVSRKSRKLFGPEKPFLKLRLAHSVKLVFSYVVKGRKIKITAKFRALRGLRFENTKRTMSPEMRPKSFGTFEKRAPGARFSKVPRTFRARKAIRETPTCLICKAGLFICCE